MMKDSFIHSSGAAAGIQGSPPQFPAAVSNYFFQTAALSRKLVSKDGYNPAVCACMCICVCKRSNPETSATPDVDFMLSCLLLTFITSDLLPFVPSDRHLKSPPENDIHVLKEVHSPSWHKTGS